MGRRHVVALFAVLGLASPATAATPPQVLDPAHDANGGVYWASDPDTTTPAGSQDYADVTAVRFATTRSTKRVGRRTVTSVTGFTVTMTLTAAPVPPAGAAAVYRVVVSGPACVSGVDHYTAPLGGAEPLTAFTDDCRGTLRRTPLRPALVKGGTITWTVPLATVPSDTRIGVGTTLTNLHFEVMVAAHPAACARYSPGTEQPPCAFLLDTTFRRTGTFVIR